MTPARLTATTYRWADRHHPIRATLRAYYRRADALYWERGADTMEEMHRQFSRLETVRQPLARAARALHRELPGGAFLGMADGLGDLWDNPLITRQIREDVVYKVDYAAYLVTERIEDMQEAADAVPGVARVLAEHLDRP